MARTTDSPISRSSRSHVAQSPRGGKRDPDRTRRTPTRRPGRSIVDQRRTRWGLIGTIVGVIAFAAVVVTMVAFGGGHRAKSGANGEVMPAAVTGSVTTEQAPKRVADTSGIAGVRAWNAQGWPGDGSSHPGALEHQHVKGPVTYTELPPVGGPHSATWLNAGIYDQPVPSERAVHNMEHGAVWITYNPSLPTAQVQALRKFVLNQSTLPEQTQSGTAKSRYIVMSPWSSDDLPSPIVISSWGHQLRVTSADDARLQRFVDTFRSSATYSPEHGEAVDGVPVSVGGRPLAS